MLAAITVYLLMGAAAGVLAGLLGIGGGLVLVAALLFVLPTQGIPPELAMHTALATSLASIVFTALSSARAHHRRGSVLWPTVAWLVPGLLLGGALGALVAARLPGAVLQVIVGVYCFAAALQLGFGRRRERADDAPPPASPGLLAAGTGIGALSAVVGIGGGSMTVPLLVWLGVKPVRAVGTSSACGVAIGLAAAAGYAVGGPSGALPEGGIGYVYLPAAVAIACASVLAAPLGTRLAHRLGSTALTRVFALFLVLVGTLVLARG